MSLGNNLAWKCLELAAFGVDEGKNITPVGGARSGLFPLAPPTGKKKKEKYDRAGRELGHVPHSQTLARGDQPVFVT